MMAMAMAICSLIGSIVTLIVLINISRSLPSTKDCENHISDLIKMMREHYAKQ